MGLIDALLNLNNETKLINSPDFSIEVSNAIIAPNRDDSALTFEDFDNNSKKVKLLETCVVFIDMRHSTQLSMQHQNQVLARLYSSFIRGVIQCAQFYEGKVRNIVGDGVMILFDSAKCCENAVNTAILLNTFSQYILNRHFRRNTIRCGIGIAYGSMMVIKAGTIKQGRENSEYKSLVWLGKPANIASKLSDFANKSLARDIVCMGRPKLGTYVLDWTDVEIDEFFNSLENVYSPTIVARFKPPYHNLQSFFKSVAYKHYPSILMTKPVYDGYKIACPDEVSIKKRFWRPRRIREISGKDVIYGGNVTFNVGKDIK